MLYLDNQYSGQKDNNTSNVGMGYTDCSHRNRDRKNSNPSQLIENMTNNQKENVQDMTNCTSHKEMRDHNNNVNNNVVRQSGNVGQVCTDVKNANNALVGNFFTERTDSYPETYSNGMSAMKDNKKGEVNQQTNVTAFDQGEPNFNSIASGTVNTKEKKSLKNTRKIDKLINSNTVDNSRFSPIKNYPNNLKHVRSGKKLKMS